MNNNLNRIYHTHTFGKNHVLILVYLFIVQLIPKLFLGLSVRHPIESTIQTIIVLSILVFLADFFQRKINNIHVIIVLISAICSLASLIKFSYSGRSIGYPMASKFLQSIVLLYTWHLLSKSKMSVLWVVIIGFLLSRVSSYFFAYFHHIIKEEDQLRYIIRFVAQFITSGTIHLLLAVGLYYILKIDKLKHPSKLK